MTFKYDSKFHCTGLSADYKHLQFQQIQISSFLVPPAAGRHTRGLHEQNGAAPLQVLHLPAKQSISHQNL